MTTPKDPRTQGAMNGPKLPISLAERIDTPGYVGARWWYEGLEREIDGVARRKALLGILALGVGIAGVGFAISKLAKSNTAGIDSDALEAQKSFGWNVGADVDALDYQAAALGEACDPTMQMALATRLRPSDAAYVPHYKATLFQALSSTPTTNGLVDTGKALRDQMRPVSNAETRLAFDKGRALGSLFEGDVAKGKAILVDLAGPLAVAFAAGLASKFEPVFAFDGWPHPKGVVPSHLTLGSALYYAELFETAAKSRPTGAPPVFVLDRARLSPYEDDSDRFDNRYLATVPTAEALAGLGVTQLLYVSTDGEKESDDLNDDFLAYKKRGTELRMVSLGDFSADPKAQAAPVAVARRGASASYESNPNVYYGGSSGTHYWFWHSYGWGSPPRPAVRPVIWSPRPVYVPSSRSTPFSGLGSGPSRTRPSDFGRVTVHTSPSTNRPIGYSRSGSWGRGGSIFGSGG